MMPNLVTTCNQAQEVRCMISVCKFSVQGRFPGKTRKTIYQGASEHGWWALAAPRRSLRRHAKKKADHCDRRDTVIEKKMDRQTDRHEAEPAQAFNVELGRGLCLKMDGETSPGTPQKQLRLLHLTEIDETDELEQVFDDIFLRTAQQH
jgi:hypothetical protein